ncbi:hypothetical protein Hsar01_02882 [Haloferula sargassicola]|uniref:Glycosyltransferase 2-like domain-containing protein n=2 Tax=Haloferula sargassicola TaxID=490096 RepID=A0ABP9UUX4_9BACT
MANVSALLRALSRVKCETLEVHVKISENDSNPDLAVSDDFMEHLTCEGKSSRIAVQLIRRKERLSLGAHMAVLFQEVQSDWQVWIGDDDLLLDWYVEELLRQVSEDASGHNVVFAKFRPSAYSEFLDEARREVEENSPSFIHEEIKQRNAGKLTTDLVGMAMRGHQLSGLMLRTSFANKAISEVNPENLYPWITCTASAIFDGGAVSYKEEAIIVTSDTPKLFSYGKDGLQGEICEALLSVPSLTRANRIQLARLVLSHPTSYWRMKLTGRNAVWRLVRRLALIAHPKIPFAVGIVSVPKAILGAMSQRWMKRLRAVA